MECRLSMASSAAIEMRLPGKLGKRQPGFGTRFANDVGIR
jgi:hypothetical protein